MGKSLELQQWAMKLSSAFLEFTKTLPGVATTPYVEGPAPKS